MTARSPTCHRLIALIPVLVGLLWPGYARAAAFDYNDSTWEGTSELLALARTRLGSSRVEIVAVLDWERLRPADGLLILHPAVDVEYDEASAFLRAGGRIAVLDDFGKGDLLLSRFQIKRVAGPLRPARALRQNANLAIAVPAVQLVAGQEQGRHPIVAQVREVVTNHPTAFTHPNLTPVLKIPALGEPDATLALTGIIVNRGRLFAMGDPSVCINLMLRYPGNRAFTEGLVDYLVEDDSWGQRGGKLYVLANEFKQRGAFGGGTSLGQEVKDQLDGLQDLVLGMHDDGLPDILAIMLSVLAGVGTLAWTVNASLKVYRRHPPRYAATHPLVAQGGVAGRAAVLGAPTTHRALALLELKSALEEGLAEQLGLQAWSSSAVLVAAVEERGLLGSPSLTELRRLLVELGRAETAVAATQPYKVTQETVERTRRAVLAILAEAKAPRDPS
ncbi:MAG: DUF4350 domain-containing protein [Myxococcales bacterium]|nr:DUF4350 domain-containing protein [Myxococcales bacterium]